MFNPKKFFTNLFKEVEGNEEYGSLFKLVLPENVIDIISAGELTLEGMLKMKFESCSFNVERNDNSSINITVYRDSASKVCGYDISISKGEELFVTCYSWRLNDEDNSPQFRLTKAAEKGIYTLTGNPVKENETYKFICEEIYYDEETSLIIGAMFADAEAMDLASECCIEGDEHILGIEGNLNNVLEYFDYRCEHYLKINPNYEMLIH